MKINLFQFIEIPNYYGKNQPSFYKDHDVQKDEDFITTLRSQKRIYTVRNMPMTEAGIDAGFTRDIYMALGEPLDNESWSVRLYHKPFVRWIWLGAILMAIGGLLAVLDKRYRLRILKKNNYYQ